MGWEKILFEKGELLFKNKVLLLPFFNAKHIGFLPVPGKFLSPSIPFSQNLFRDFITVLLLLLVSYIISFTVLPSRVFNIIFDRKT